MTDFIVIFAGAVAWFASGFAGSCTLYAYVQYEWLEIADDYRLADTIIAWFFALFGPISFVALILYTNVEHGFLLPGTKP